jgi:hypothetical protein
MIIFILVIINHKPNVIFSKDQTAVIDYNVQHKLPGDVCNCPTCQSSMEMVTRPTKSLKMVLDGTVPNSTGVDSSLVEQTSLKYWNICITVFSPICTCLSTELTFVHWLHRYVTYNHLSKVMGDLSKNDPARMVRYVWRFGHLWLAQRHPKPSLADRNKS